MRSPADDHQPLPPESWETPRRFPRTSAQVLIQYRFNTREEFITEYSANISAGGIFIKTDSPAEKGTLVHLRFIFQDGSPLIESLGQVARVCLPGDASGLSGMGIEFVNLDSELRAAIENIVSRRNSSGGRESGK